MFYSFPLLFINDSRLSYTQDNARDSTSGKYLFQKQYNVNKKCNNLALAKNIIPYVSHFLGLINTSLYMMYGLKAM